MCGLAGIYNYGEPVAKPLSEQTGLAMIDALTHRGPDDAGLLVTSRLLLGHRRLSILDLSTDGHQPMTDAAEECWIAFNGEIYNFRELRRELESTGQRFHSRTDTEVILRGYQQWGIEVIKRLNGMFAFALWDRKQQTFWLVRDPIGIKPLFFHDDGRSLRFGSEIKAILADPDVARQADCLGLDGFLTFGYVPAPLTGFEGIHQLRPGEYLKVQAGQIFSNVWYSLPYPKSPTKAGPDECVERLEAALDAAVSRQMVSDVPLGAFLSGGLDSSAVVRSMRRSGSIELDTFTIKFAEESFDESPYAARVSNRYSTRHHAQAMSPVGAEMLRTVIAHAEDPLSDNSMVPFFLLSQHARRDVKVALSGDGADELLGGYMTYAASRWAPYYRSIPGFVRRKMVEPVIPLLPDTTRKYGFANVLRRFVAGASRPFPWDHCSWRRIVSADLRPELYSPKFLSSAHDDPLSSYAETLEDVPDWASPLEQQLHLDLRFHLPNDMLVKVDRMSMAHSLEVRVPFLDQEVIAACLSMPPECRRRGSRGKLPLRHMLQRDLSDDLVNRKKGGFLIPLETWLRGPWQPLLREMLTGDFAKSTELLQPKTLQRMLDSHARGRGDFSYPLFSLLVLSLWWESWITKKVDPHVLRPVAAPTKITRRDHFSAS